MCFSCCLQVEGGSTQFFFFLFALQTSLGIADEPQSWQLNWCACGRPLLVFWGVAAPSVHVKTQFKI